MPANVTSIKNQIAALLDELVTAGTLGAKTSDDYQQGIFDRDYPAFPAAILATPATDSEVYTNTQVYRTHSFEIVVLMKGENVASSTDVETLIETLLDKFDHNPTLAGTCQELTAASSQPAAVTDRGKRYIAFSITLRAKAIKAP